MLKCRFLKKYLERGYFGKEFPHLSLEEKKIKLGVLGNASLWTQNLRWKISITKIVANPKFYLWRLKMKVNVHILGYSPSNFNFVLWPCFWSPQYWLNEQARFWGKGEPLSFHFLSVTQSHRHRFPGAGWGVEPGCVSCFQCHKQLPWFALKYGVRSSCFLLGAQGECRHVESLQTGVW